MAARNKPAGIRSLVYGIGKGKGCIEGLSVLRPEPSHGAKSIRRAQIEDSIISLKV